MSRLQDRLDRIKKAFAEKAPAEARAVMEKATADLRESGILERVPRVGSTLPAFDLPDGDGGRLRSADLLAKGPLVVTFYRGVW